MKAGLPSMRKNMAETILKHLGTCSEAEAPLFLGRLVVSKLPPTSEECGPLPGQYSWQFREGVVALA